MKSKAIKELHTKTVSELQTLLKDLRQDRFSMKVNNSQQKLKNTALLYHAKKDIARVQTVLHTKIEAEKK